jgi:hypothetical protein
MPETKIIPELDPWRDFAVLKSNGMFAGSFTIASGDATISYGDGTIDVSNTPIHTFTGNPPYIINVTGLDLDTITGISISGNNLTSVDVSKFRNLSSLVMNDNIVNSKRIGDLLTSLDENGVENGELNIRYNNYLRTQLDGDVIRNLEIKGWNLSQGLWTPNEITTAMWFDASDARTVYQDPMTGTVSRWDDKSGNGYHAVQGTGSNQPNTGTRTINGLNVIDFDQVDGNKWMQMENGPQNDSDSIMITVIEPYDANPSNDNRVFTGAENNSSTRWTLILDVFDEQKVGYLQSNSFSGTGLSSSTNSFTDSPLIASGYRDGTQSYGGTNGVYGSPAVANDDTIDRWVLGARAQNNPFPSGPVSNTFKGAIGEFIIIKEYNLELLQKLEGYLSWKWGVVDNLPIDHPYKTDGSLFGF